MNSKYLVITEVNKWEREAWRFCFDIEKNDCVLLSDLMTLIKRIDKKNLETYNSLNKPLLCAISFYRLAIIDHAHALALSESRNCTYMKACTIFDTNISKRKLKGVINRVNKSIDSDNFEDPFYKGEIESIMLRK